MGALDRSSWWGLNSSDARNARDWRHWLTWCCRAAEKVKPEKSGCPSTGGVREPSSASPQGRPAAGSWTVLRTASSHSCMETSQSRNVASTSSTSTSGAVT
eukprot:1124854-Rhodomonas_salina.1